MKRLYPTMILNSRNCVYYYSLTINALPLSKQNKKNINSSISTFILLFYLYLSQRKSERETGLFLHLFPKHFYRCRLGKQQIKTQNNAVEMF